jgi:hypothetical protein
MKTRRTLLSAVNLAWKLASTATIRGNNGSEIFTRRSVASVAKQLEMTQLAINTRATHTGAA